MSSVVDRVVRRVTCLSPEDRLRATRNIAVIAHVDHGKTTLTDALVARAGLIASADGRRFMDSRPDEKARTITIKSSAITLPFDLPVRRRSRRDSKARAPSLPRMESKAEARTPTPRVQSKAKARTPSPRLRPRYKRDESLRWPSRTSDSAPARTEPLVVNLIDSPGHVDFSSEVTAALRLADGALVLVDAAKGVCVQTRTVVKQALAERVTPVLFLNKLDKMFTKWPDDPEACYQALRRTVESANALILSGSDSDGGGDATEARGVWPQNGSVAFGSGLQGWGFTLHDFARVYHDRLGISEKKAMKKLWGENFFNSKSKKWSPSRKRKASERGFVRYVLKPMYSLHHACKDMDTDALDVWTRRLGLRPSLKDKGLSGDKLFEWAMRNWLPAADAVLSMVRDHTPSPAEAQPRRIPQLYSGSPDSAAARAMAACDPSAPLAMYVSKLIPTGDAKRFYAFGRVFSGTLRSGQTVRVLPSGGSAGEHRPASAVVRGVRLMMGPHARSAAVAYPGDIVGLTGLDGAIVKRATVLGEPSSGGASESQQTLVPFRDAELAVAPVVRVAVTTAKPALAARLASALRRLAQSDSLVEYSFDKATGQWVLAGCGELHLQVCLKDLSELYMGGAKLVASEPAVSFRETVAGQGIGVKVKSANKLNRLHVAAWPLEPAIVSAVTGEAGASALRDPRVCADAKARAAALASEFGWDARSARRVWDLDCVGASRANVLVDETVSSQYAHEARDAITDGFGDAVAAGPLTGEPVSGVHVAISELKLHADANHRSARQLTPAARRATHAAMLKARIRILEPVFEVTVSAPKAAEAGAYAILRKRGARIIGHESDRAGGSEIKSLLPVRHSFGLAQALRAATRGEAFAQTRMAQWSQVPGCPLELGTEAHSVVADIRKRKGLPAKIPTAEDLTV